MNGLFSLLERVMTMQNGIKGIWPWSLCFICVPNWLVAAHDEIELGVPSQLLSSFGSYPNPWNLTAEDRELFAPVVRFPQRPETGELHYRILDHTKPWEDQPSQLVSPEEHERARRQQSCQANQQGQDSDNSNSNNADDADENESQRLQQAMVAQRQFDWYGVGRYDENRIGMYESQLFSVENPEDQRTVHIAIDLDGPVNTPVHAFYHGTVHSVGYNEALGDYGNVIVLEHPVPNADGNNSRKSIFALYGHLNSTVVERYREGQQVTKGQVLGGMGSFWENGGWAIPHVHFQLSVNPPLVPHDMPGAVAPKDRGKALWDYPDPRYVLGPLY